MTLLWADANRLAQRFAVWYGSEDDKKRGIRPEDAVPAREAGYKGYVGSEHLDSYAPENEFDEDTWDKVRPEPTKEDEKHFDKHGEYPDNYYDRHEEAYQDAKDKEAPHHSDDDVHEFTASHGADADFWHKHATLGPVSLKDGAWATQSHVHPHHVDRYKADPQGETWQTISDDHAGNGDYLANAHPMFVTHKGHLHVTDGHHRVAAALQSGDKSIHAWHYDADKHGFPESEEDW